MPFPCEFLSFADRRKAIYDAEWELGHQSALLTLSRDLTTDFGSLPQSCGAMQVQALSGKWVKYSIRHGFSLR